jgi:hypothetical protein
MSPFLKRASLAVLIVSLSSCAVGNTAGPQPVSMSAARAGLAPEYRIFYDALQDYGDWVLIEPYGYLFRPRTTYHDWRPYESGFWAPTDAYGWVWISNEPFGWATYHYGRWAYDDFQGWVWKPGLDWAPAWVDWRANDQYVGWAPLSPGGGTPKAPGGAYVFTPMTSMGSTDLSSQVKTQTQMGAVVAGARPVSETVVVDGIRAPSGPSVERVESLLGQKLPRAQIDEVLSKRPLEQAREAGASPPPTLDELRQAGEESSREAKALTEQGGPARGRVPLLRPSVRRGVSKPHPLVPPSLRDSTARRGRR